jgi:hypothetical protein
MNMYLWRPFRHCTFQLSLIGYTNMTVAGNYEQETEDHAMSRVLETQTYIHAPSEIRTY